MTSLVSKFTSTKITTDLLTLVVQLNVFSPYSITPKNYRAAKSHAYLQKNLLPLEKLIMYYVLILSHFNCPDLTFYGQFTIFRIQKMF